MRSPSLKIDYLACTPGHGWKVLGRLSHHGREICLMRRNLRRTHARWLHRLLPLLVKGVHLDTVLKIESVRFLDRHKRKLCQPCHRMNPNSKSLPALAEIEREVVAESREWGRQRLEQRLQNLAEEHGEVFPPKATPKQKPHAAKRIRRRKAGR